MGTKLRFFVVLVGALLVVATYTFPLWQPRTERQQDEVQFPELAEDLQAAFQALPGSVQRAYLAMREQNAVVAAELVSARLQPDEPLPPEEQEPPPTEAAVAAAEGEFGPPQLMDEDDTRQMPPFNQIYDAAGTAIIYQYPDNSKILRIEDLQVVNGPNLHVILSMHPAPLTGAELGRDFIDIGALKSSTGNQNYESVPTEIDVANYASVVIYDNTHGIVFAVAPLTLTQ